MNNLKFDHRGLCVNSDNVIKKWNRNFPLEDWWAVYQIYQKFDPRVVQILEVNINSNYFVMEKLHGIDLEQEIDQLNFHEKKHVLKETVDIFSNFFKFKSRLLHPEELFFHVDFRLSNLMFTNNKEIKLLDPDSFDIVALDKPNNVLNFGRYLDCLVTLKEQILLAGLK